MALLTLLPVLLSWSPSVNAGERGARSCKLGTVSVGPAAMIDPWIGSTSYAAYCRPKLSDLLESLKEQAESTNESRARFLAAASHDLRQPLHALGLFASALSERIREEDAPELDRRIQNSTESLSGMLDALLDFAFAVVACLEGREHYRGAEGEAGEDAQRRYEAE